MRYFEKRNISERYDKYRPQVHRDIIQKLLELASCKIKFQHVADIACGTGHSTRPLLDYSENVSGTDISQEMLNIAKERDPQVSYYLTPAEDLPFADSSLDAIFVCMALHWFDQEKFLSEVRRTLKSGGWLFIYNMWFPGQMIENSRYTDWHTKEYWAKYPNPKRHTTPLKKLLENNDKIEFVGSHLLDILVDFDSLELRNYLMTQSNIDAAIDKGHSAESVEGWIDDGVKPFFNTENEQFIYSCELSYAKCI
jgi:ubiquinone/menaquinone biosynthesis C-methylase UbiE